MVSEFDPIERPEHYNTHPSGIECIEITENLICNVANAVKYLFRCGLKEGSPLLEDLKKARWYINREINRCVEICPQLVIFPHGKKVSDITMHHNYCVGNSLYYLLTAGQTGGMFYKEGLKWARKFIDLEILRVEGS